MYTHTGGTSNDENQVEAIGADSWQRLPVQPWEDDSGKGRKYPSKKKGETGAFVPTCLRVCACVNVRVSARAGVCVCVCVRACGACAKIGKCVQDKQELCTRQVRK